jgi:hypothetical protein
MMKEQTPHPYLGKEKPGERDIDQDSLVHRLRNDAANETIPVQVVCCEEAVSELSSENREGHTFDGVGVRVGVQLVLLVRQPEPAVAVKDLLAQ